MLFDVVVGLTTAAQPLFIILKHTEILSATGNIYMGYTMRTDRYRYTEWTAFHPGPDFKPSFGRIFHQQGRISLRPDLVLFLEFFPLQQSG